MESLINGTRAKPAARGRRRAITLRSFIPYLLIAPAFLVMLAIIAYPIVDNFSASLMSQATLSRPARFVGLRNYARIVGDDVFFPALQNTLLWTVGVTALQFTLGLVLALLLSQRFPGRWLFRSLAILPWVTPGIVVAVTWRLLYAEDFGVINLSLRSLGLGALAQAWLADARTAMPAVMMVGAWKGFGFYMVMLLAGLQGIPVEIFEAARIDGANRLQTLWHVTLPQLRPIILMSVLLGIIWTSNYFDAIFVLTEGGPARLTETLPIFIYKTAFSFFDLNKAIAGSIILLLIVLLLASLYLVAFLKLGRREDEL